MDKRVKIIARVLKGEKVAAFPHSLRESYLLALEAHERTHNPIWQRAKVWL